MSFPVHLSKIIDFIQSTGRFSELVRQVLCFYLDVDSVKYGSMSFLLKMNELKNYTLPIQSLLPYSILLFIKI